MEYREYQWHPPPQWEPQLRPSSWSWWVQWMSGSKLSGQIVGHSGVCGAGKAAEQLDACLHQCYLRTGADATAEHDICAMLHEKARQCAVALTIRRDDLGAQELAIFGLIELELCGAAKVLKHLTVFERDCDFHENVSFTACFVQPPGCSLPAFWRPEA